MTVSKIVVSLKAGALANAISTNNKTFNSNEMKRKRATSLSQTQGFPCLTPTSLSPQIAKPTATKAAFLMAREQSRIKEIERELRAADLKASKGIR